MFKKTERMVVDVGINPRAVPPRLFLPIVENASMQDDEDLHTIKADEYVIQQLTAVSLRRRMSGNRSPKIYRSRE
jgi:hypothetical protein